MKRTFRYADETFTVIRRVTHGKWKGYLLCRTTERVKALVYFRED